MKALFVSQLALAAALGLLSSLGFVTAAAADKPAAQKIVVPVVNVAAARETDVVETVLVTGTLVPRDEILVGPEIEGLRIIELLVDEGELVEKGQVLARLSKETLVAQVAQSDAQLGRADADRKSTRLNSSH